MIIKLPVITKGITTVELLGEIAVYFKKAIAFWMYNE